MFDVTGLCTVFIIVVLSVCMNLRGCVCNFNVYYLHVIYALTFVFTFMLTDKFFTSLHPSMMCLIGIMYGLQFVFS
jgi:hypothetical protein